MHWTGNASMQFAYFFLLLSANKPAGHYTHRTGWKNTQTHLYSFICPLVASICPFDRLSVRHRRYIALPYEPLIHQRLIGRCVRFLVQFASTDYAVHSPCACIILYPPNVEKWKAFFVVAFPFDYMYVYIYMCISAGRFCVVFIQSLVSSVSLALPAIYHCLIHPQHIDVHTWAKPPHKYTKHRRTASTVGFFLSLSFDCQNWKGGTKNFGVTQAPFLRVFLFVYIDIVLYLCRQLYVRTANASSSPPPPPSFCRR